MSDSTTITGTMPLPLELVLIVSNQKIWELELLLLRSFGLTRLLSKEESCLTSQVMLFSTILMVPPQGWDQDLGLQHISLITINQNVREIQ
jgi:hypothetical protein